jgi:glutathione S-transferase
LHAAHAPSSPLFPIEVRARANVDRWMDAQQTQLNRPMSAVFWGLVRTPADRRDLGAVAQAIQDTARAWALVEAELNRHPFIGGETFTLCDIPWGVHAHRWFGMNYLGLERPEFPALRTWYSRLCQRPSYQQHVAGCPIS